MKIVSHIMIFLTLMSCNQKNQNSQGEQFNSNVNKVMEHIVDDSAQLQFFNKPQTPIQPKFTLFPTGSVTPAGWILEMMQNDLKEGIVGALDELYPGIKADDIYRTHRRGGLEDIPEMGDLVLSGEAWETSIMWWNAETIGNWWDGFVRHAFLTNNDLAIAQSDKIINNIMASQDDDGYIGIYKPNLRYQHEGSNGELWAQTTVFRTMLAYYEFTGKVEVLNAVEKGMAVTMKHYNWNAKNPFYLKNAFGGVTHGLMLTDVCETLYRITNNEVYKNYGTYLYKAFSTYSINRSFNDLRYPFLKEKDSLFQGHGVHTYEHIRSMVNAYFNTGYKELKTAYDNMLHKLEPCILPSGAGHGNEWLMKLSAHPDHTGAEYCTMLELRNSYGSLLQKTGEGKFGDQAETLTYNAMLGARNKSGTAITYGKPDNCYILDGHHYENGEKRKDPRFKYSPTHSEPAVCCVPNYGRNFTYFLEQMWMKTNDGIAATMFGPSQLKTHIEDTSITIEQSTNYPMSDEISFKFSMDAPKSFKFYIRKPEWSDGLADDTVMDEVEEGFYVAEREWRDGDILKIRFKNKIMMKQANNDESYIQRGPLVFAYAIPHKEKVIKAYADESFEDYYCFPENEKFKNLILNEQEHITFAFKNNEGSFYDCGAFLGAQFQDKSNGDQSRVKLIPMGQTVLRKVTFPSE